VTSALERVDAFYRNAFDTSPAPTVTWSAPGRVNLIGEHTDYNDGFVLPFALPHRTAVTLSPNGSDHWRVRSEAEPAEVSFDRADLEPGRVPGWAGYVAGVLWALRESDVDVPGATVAITSDVPVGAGLSSSAAIECATLAAFLDLAGALGAVPVARWPALAQRAENGYVGVPCGILDQSAATLCQAGHALFLDCRSQELEQVPFDLAPLGLTMLVIDTRAPHRHADSEYAARRASCEAAARTLSLPALRDVVDLTAALDALPDELSRRRVRHVVTENQRVLDTVRLLRAGAVAEIGPLLTASHASLRDDYEVTVPEVDLAAEVALSAGALGARMTGGGFGGCVIALTTTDRATPVAAAVRAAFAAHAYPEPSTFPATPAPGASPLHRRLPPSPLIMKLTS
jgi:galactokinase